MPKISIIGAGAVGCQTAFLIAEKNLGNVVLVDIIEGLAEGRALDLSQSLPVLNSNIKIIGTTDYSLTKDSDIVVITAGSPRKPGMSREDLININSKILKSIVSEIIKYSPNCSLIVITNPLNIMTQLAYKLSNFPKNRVIGMAGILDSSRLKFLISKELNTNINNIEAFVLGDHGDLMVPIISQCKVNNKPLTQFLSKEKINRIIEKTRNAGAEIINLSKQSSCFAPACSITEMLDSIINNKSKILPCSVLLEGEYNINNLFLGVPIKLGKNGVEEIIELNLDESEKSALINSANYIKNLINKL